MATVYLTIGQVLVHDVFVGGTTASETVTSSGTSAQGLLTANKGDIAQVVCASAVYATTAATATAANGIYCPAGLPTYIAMPEGGKIAVIDA
jgi:hypothetical protein